MAAQTSVSRQAPRSPIGRALLTLPAAVVVIGGVCLWATARTPAADDPFVVAFSVTAAVLLCIAVAVVAYTAQAAAQLRVQVARMHADAARLNDDTLSAVVKRLRDGESVETVLAEVPQPADAVHQRIVRTLAHEIGRSERRRTAAMSACANAAGRVQALTTSMLADLRDMENRYAEDVLGDLLKLDHTTAQASRLADSIAVLTGARSGRRWTKPIVMESVLRGAVSRISAYQRVRMHSNSTVAVAGYAAEGVIHALAELMDNATSFSPPSDEVHVYVEEVHAGVVVTIEDGGLAMSAAALRRAEETVSAGPLNLTTLSGTRLGLAVVGCLAHKHGLTVSFRPSSRGGTGVVVLIPRQLITEPRNGGTGPVMPAAERTPEPAPPRASGSSGGAHAAPEPGDPPVLPKRHRGQTAMTGLLPAPAPQPGPARPRSDIGDRFSAFRQTSRSQHPSRHLTRSPEEESR
ncbi:ATP-binding protein [Lentzea sp. NPDC004782]|uniref:sensor histidine kinase n=1 Tax=Lentzea sp. NPDC004782 TaxID=3154458 RepID=UPI0033AB29EA